MTVDREYYSKGKLLLTGEYLLLEGALSLALPLKLGQTMKVGYLKEKERKLYWKTFVMDRPWFQATYNLETLKLLDSSDNEKALFIQKILIEAFVRNKKIARHNFSTTITTYIDFLPEWGLGSSSSLFSNVAYWIHADPFQLLWTISEGSGYDIACARAKGPILYQLKNGRPISRQVSFQPDFHQNIYFIYLGNKQDSAQSIIKYRMNIERNRKSAEKISMITKRIIASVTLDDFESCLVAHEDIVSEVLNEPTIKTRLFDDYPGVVKSLGAWGGDFILVTGKTGREDVEDYFQKKGYSVIFTYNEIVL
jgi:mevalonate kinase